MYLEHANITVSDIDAAVRFLGVAFPNFEVRGSGEYQSHGQTRKWLHFGNETTYLALEQFEHPEDLGRTPYRQNGINHVGFVVEGFESLRSRLLEAGFREGQQETDHPHRKRTYFFDSDDNEYEFVEYLSDDPNDRNTYG